MSVRPKPGLGSGANSVFAARRTPTTNKAVGGAAPRKGGLVAHLAEDDTTRNYVIEVDLDERLASNPENPRKDFGDLSGFVRSLENHGLIQPIVVWTRAAFLEHVPDQADALADEAQWVIIAGHRRRAAALEAGMTKLPAIVGTNNNGNRGHLTRALSENVHRKDLTALEEARALSTLRDVGLSQRQIATQTGISQSQISKRLNLLELPVQVQDAIEEGAITVIDALTQLRALPEGEQLAALEEVRSGTAKSLESAVRQQKARAASDPQPRGTTPEQPSRTTKDPDPEAPGAASSPSRTDLRAEPAPAPQVTSDRTPEPAGHESAEPRAVAAEARGKACALAATSSLKTAEIQELLVDVVLDPPRAKPTRALAVALKWLRLPAPADIEQHVAEALDAGGKQTNKLAVATALARRELDLVAAAGEWDPAMRRHVRRLVAWGVHTPNDYEVSKLAAPSD